MNYLSVLESIAKGAPKIVTAASIFSLVKTLSGSTINSCRSATTIVAGNIAINSPITVHNTIKMVRKGHPGKIIRAIMSDGNEMLFPSINEASKILGVSRLAIRNSIIDPKKVVDGIKFVYEGDMI